MAFLQVDIRIPLLDGLRGIYPISLIHALYTVRILVLQAQNWK